MLWIDLRKLLTEIQILRNFKYHLSYVLGSGVF